MAIQTINLGTYANDGTGDDLRSAFEKVNLNFAELDATSAVTAVNVGSNAPVFKEKIGDDLYLRTIEGTGIVTVSYNNSDIRIDVPNNFIVLDTAPQLGGDLDLNGNNIVGSGTITASGFVGDLNGNASTSSAWVTPRTLTLSGDLTGSVVIDGSQNLTLSATVVGGTGGGTIELGGDLDFGSFTSPLEFALDAGTF